MPSLPYHVYMDLGVDSHDFSFSNIPLLRFEETRGYPFLAGDSAGYFCSGVRFSVQTANSLPVFIPKIDPNGDVVINGIPLSTMYTIAVQVRITQTTTGTDARQATTYYTGTRSVLFTARGMCTGTRAVPSDYYYI